jgi:hypothetical protein
MAFICISTGNIADLDYLLLIKSLIIKSLITPNYQKDVLQYQHKLQNFNVCLVQLKINYKINLILLEKGVIAQTLFEEKKWSTIFS